MRAAKVTTLTDKQSDGAHAPVMRQGRSQAPARKEGWKMAKLLMKDVFTKEAYEYLTPSHRRRLLKAEQAKAYSKWGRYPSTWEAVMKYLPDDVWERYTAKQIGEVVDIVHDAFVAGTKKAAEATNFDAQ
jgi:hypothetical protein